MVFHGFWHPLHCKDLFSPSPADVWSAVVAPLGITWSQRAPQWPAHPSSTSYTSSMACTSFLYILHILTPAPILHHSDISTLFSAQSVVPKTMSQCGSLPLPHLWPYPESRRNITNIDCLPWTDVHYPHTGLSVDWTPNRISGLWTGGSKILTEETSNENALAVFWQDAVLLWERTVGQEDKSQLRGDWASFLQVTYLAFNLRTVV